MVGAGLEGLAAAWGRLYTGPLKILSVLSCRLLRWLGGEGIFSWEVNLNLNFRATWNTVADLSFDGFHSELVLSLKDSSSAVYVSAPKIKNRQHSFFDDALDLWT
jgi:hypothetical protein